MISFAHPWLLVLVVPALAWTLFAWRNPYVNLTSTRMRWALALRTLLLLAVILSLARTSVRVPQSREAVVFVADLSASDAGQRSEMQSLINNAAANRPGNDVMGVVTVGRQPLVEQPVSGVSGFGAFQTSVDPQFSNVAGGIDLANALLPAEYRHRIVLMSDGQQNIGDALASAHLMRAGGTRLDVVPVHVPAGPEVLLDRVDAPPQLRAHESFELTVTVRSTVSTTTAISVVRDHTVAGDQTEAVHPGMNRFTFPESPLSPGFHTYRVQLSPARDTEPQNNSGSAYVSVAGGPRVLVIAEQPREATNVLTSLRSTGIGADLRAPQAVPPQLTYLQHYAGVVIVDTDATTLGPSLMAQLVPFVRDLGRGLVVIGGQNAYSMGGYGGTPLEAALPVRMDLPRKRSTPTVAVALVIESLEEDTQINISKQAGKGVVNLLTAQDQVAVNDAPYDSSSGWVVPLQHVRNRGAIDAAIERMAPGDPETYTPALQSAFSALQHSSARVKHIILLGDGDAEDPGYQQLVENFHAHGVTVSTIGTNGLGRSDIQTMRNIAQWGGGRYYAADDPSRIPQIFLREARTVARVGVVEGKFFPQELSSNPMLRDVARVAPLYGYIATTPRPAGEIVLASGKLDPILAAWQFGLGRAVAWTSDAAGLWTRDWLRAPGANRFWADLVSWTFPPVGAGHLTLSTSSTGGLGHISVGTPPSLGADPAVTARVVDPELHASTIQLLPSAPGRFDGSFAERAPGAYFITLQARGAGHAEVGQIGMVAPYSLEYATTGTDSTFLRSLASEGGGSVMTSGRDAWSDNLAGVLATYDLTFWLSLLAVLLLPIDVGVRRLRIGRRELDAILAALPRRATSGAQRTATIHPLVAMRLRRSQRGATAASPAAQPPPLSGRGAVAGTASHAPAPTPLTAPSMRAPSTPSPEEESTASKLLAARRKRRSS